jgi:hypothetical protein
VRTERADEAGKRGGVGAATGELGEVEGLEGAGGVEAVEGGEVEGEGQVEEEVEVGAGEVTFEKTIISHTYYVYNTCHAPTNTRKTRDTRHLHPPSD